MILQMSN